MASVRSRIATAGHGRPIITVRAAGAAGGVRLLCSAVHTRIHGSSAPVVIHGNTRPDPNPPLPCRDPHPQQFNQPLWRCRSVAQNVGVRCQRCHRFRHARESGATTRAIVLLLHRDAHIPAHPKIGEHNRSPVLPVVRRSRYCDVHSSGARKPQPM